MRRVRETAVVIAAELLPGMERVLFHLWQGFLAPAPLTFGLDIPLLWRTVLYMAGCSAAPPASAPWVPVIPLPLSPGYDYPDVSAHC